MTMGDIKDKYKIYPIVQHPDYENDIAYDIDDVNEIIADFQSREKKLTSRLDNAKKRYEIKCQEVDDCSAFSTKQALEINDFNSRTCEWKIDDESMYYASCGHLWEFTEGSLEDNNDCKYCPYCGSKITEFERKEV